MQHQPAEQSNQAVVKCQTSQLLQVKKGMKLQDKFNNINISGIRGFSEELDDIFEDEMDEHSVDLHKKKDKSEQQLLSSIQPAVSPSSRKRARTKESVHFKKQKVKAYEQQNSYRVKKLSENTFEIKDRNVSLKKGKRLPAFGNDTKIVTFDFEAKQVSCTFPAWIGLQLGKNSDDVCKHIPIVTMKCDKMLSHLYYGNRNMIAYDVYNLKGILATFVEDQEIENPSDDNEENRKKKRKTVSSEPGALLNKQSMLQIQDVGPFASKELALSHAPDNKWYGELYKVGGNPSCRTCGKKVTNENKVVIRTDVATAFQNPNKNSKSKEFLLRSETVRFCLNTFCHKNLPVKNYRHIMKLASLNLGYLPTKYHEEFKNVFKHTAIGLEYE